MKLSSKLKTQSKSEKKTEPLSIFAQNISKFLYNYTQNMTKRKDKLKMFNFFFSCFKQPQNIVLYLNCKQIYQIICFKALCNLIKKKKKKR